MKKNRLKSVFDQIEKRLVVILFLSLTGSSFAQTKTFATASFDKVIVSPHIQVNFVEGNHESAAIRSISVPMEKMNVEVIGKTLRLYLDDAKMVTKSERVERNGREGNESIYKGTIVTALVTYKKLNELSLRGEEKFVCESPLKMEKFRLKIYGESQVYLNQVALQTLQATIYGESYLEIRQGTIGRQRFTAYGETKINALNIQNKTTKITAYGEGSYRVNVSDKLKVTAYGEATVAYEGNPDVDKGIVIGEAKIQKIR